MYKKAESFECLTDKSTPLFSSSPPLDLLFLVFLACLPKKMAESRDYHSLLRNINVIITSNHFLFVTVEPPVSDHPICQALVVAYGRWSLTRAWTISKSGRSRLREVVAYKRFQI